MRFHFDIDKSIAATAYLLRKSGGSQTILFLVKMLYDANRQSLLRFGRSMTGDSFCSMENGPVVSETYNLLKGADHCCPEDLEKWGKFISPRSGHIITLMPEANPEIGYLSRREIELLDQSFIKVKSVKGKISDWAHEVFPEWEKVDKHSRKPLPAERIFEKENFPKEKISSLAEEINNLTWLKLALGK